MPGIWTSILPPPGAYSNKCQIWHLAFGMPDSRCQISCSNILLAIWQKSVPISWKNARCQMPEKFLESGMPENQILTRFVPIKKLFGNLACQMPKKFADAQEHRQTGKIEHFCHFFCNLWYPMRVFIYCDLEYEVRKIFRDQKKFFDEKIFQNFFVMNF